MRALIPAMQDISLITIGAELLKGHIVNTNAAKAGLMLREQGFSLHRVLTINDDSHRIIDAVQTELQHSRVVIISGGLGPTKDDVTKHSLARWFGSELAKDIPTEQALEARYANSGRTLNPLTRQQALVPIGCTVLPNALGTAPGMAFEKEGRWVYALPGVPYEMLHLLEAQVIPHILTQFAGGAFRRRVLRLAGLPESDAADRMAALEAQLPAGLDIAYLPRQDGLWLEFTTHRADGDGVAADATLAAAWPILQAGLAEFIYAEGDAPLAQLLGEELLQRDWTLAVAESLTGGTLAAKIVSISGASRYFMGGVDAYAIRVKSSLLEVPPEMIAEAGVVSSAVAEAMAQGVRKLLGTDMALATTGEAEASKGNPGEVWIGYADAHQSDSQHAILRYTRTVNMERAAYYALQFGLKKVKATFE